MQTYKPGSVNISSDILCLLFIYVEHRCTTISAYPLKSNEQFSNSNLFGISTLRVYSALRITTQTGELLPHLFTITANKLEAVIFCSTFPITPEA